MTVDIVVVGCGGHGREVLGIIDAINGAAPAAPPWQTVGFVDDAPTEINLKRVQTLGLPYLGTLDWLRTAPPTTCVAVAIGDPRSRRVVGARVDGYGLPIANLIHPAATLSPDIVTGAGLIVFAGARVTTNVQLGRHVHLNQNVTIGHDAILSDYVSVNPLAAVSGECQLGAGVLIGTTAAVLQGRRVGEHATVGAGACVVRDVPPRTVVKGVPAR